MKTHNDIGKSDPGPTLGGPVAAGIFGVIALLGVLAVEGGLNPLVAAGLAIGSFFALIVGDLTAKYVDAKYNGAPGGAAAKVAKLGRNGDTPDAEPEPDEPDESDESETDQPERPAVEA